MAQPLVSIVIPGYRTEFLEPALESAFAQTHAETEIVVSDNCPTDEVRQIVARDYPRVRYHRNPVRGIYSNFRSCIRLARGEYVKFLLDDDLLAPHCVATMLQAFAHQPAATLVSSCYEIIDAAGKRVRVRETISSDRPVLFAPGGAGRFMLQRADNFFGPLTTSMFRRRCLPLGIGPWFFHAGAKEQYFGLIDVAILLDLAYQGRVAILPQILSAVRHHANALSNVQCNPLAGRSISAWLPLALDAHAFGLISEVELRSGLEALLPRLRRWQDRFPDLAAEAARVEDLLQTRPVAAGGPG